MSGVEVLKNLRFAAQDSRQVEEEERVPELSESTLIYKEFCASAVMRAAIGLHICNRSCEIRTALVAIKEEYYIVSAAGQRVEKLEQTREAAGRSYEKRVWVTRSPAWRGTGLYAGIPQGGRAERRMQDGKRRVIIEGPRPDSFSVSLNVNPQAARHL